MLQSIRRVWRIPLLRDEKCLSSLASDRGSIDVASHSLSRPTRQKFKNSLVAETLASMEEDEEFQLTAKKLKEMGQKKLTLDEKKRLRRSLADFGLPSFDGVMDTHAVALERVPAEYLQMNIGLYCNQACSHCHVESSPRRQEMMSREVADQCLHIIANSPSISTVDLTGGAPELCTEFRYLVEQIRGMGKEVIDRCNLTVLTEPGQEDLAFFLRDHQVKVIASLPCYSFKNVESQRGKGVFDRSISGLQLLNEVGYGQGDPSLSLDLVYNPLGAFLPPEQAALEAKYKEELVAHFGITFDQLFAFANMPIKRFADFLHRRGELGEYMDLLVRNFNPQTVPALMCTNTVSVSWKGSLHDCDFNQQLDIGVEAADKGKSLSVFDINCVEDLQTLAIATDEHCFGCTAGSGSS